MSERQHVSVITEGMMYNEDETWTANGHVQFASGKEIKWTASHKKGLVVKFEDSGYPDEIMDQLKMCIKGALGMINLPYSRSYEIRLK